MTPAASAAARATPAPGHARNAIMAGMAAALPARTVRVSPNRSASRPPRRVPATPPVRKHAPPKAEISPRPEPQAAIPQSRKIEARDVARRALWNAASMNVRRIVLLVTCLAVIGLLVWLTMAKWSSASKIAAVVSALGAVAAVGVAIWAAFPGSVSAGSVRASRTGKAIARRGSHAISGIALSTHNSQGKLNADRTGDAEASDGGEATSGIRLD